MQKLSRLNFPDNLPITWSPGRRQTKSSCRHGSKLCSAPTSMQVWGNGRFRSWSRKFEPTHNFNCIHRTLENCWQSNNQPADLEMSVAHVSVLWQSGCVYMCVRNVCVCMSVHTYTTECVEIWVYVCTAMWWTRCGDTWTHIVNGYIGAFALLMGVWRRCASVCLQS